MRVAMSIVRLLLAALLAWLIAAAAQLAGFVLKLRQAQEIRESRGDPEDLGWWK
jgi:hypothetical protein